jgi:peptidoglycan/xylan/chitin deacetylase (PgdA/CDA1 family)
MKYRKQKDKDRILEQGKLFIIWDYDGAIGRINSSYPYKFDEGKLYREIENVEKILTLCDDFQLKMTFACVGFGAEPGQYPYHIPEQIKKIHALGHEIASHSWKHEWFPYLEKTQIQRSLARSKVALETCIGEEGAVSGFILPFSRPMSWYARGAFSLGDRVFGPWYPGADLGAILKFIHQAGYRWSRIDYQPIWKKLFCRVSQGQNLNQAWTSAHGVTCVPSHVFGFDAGAREWLTRVSTQGGSLVVSGHPAALDFGREESLENLNKFVKLAANFKAQGRLQFQTVSAFINERDQ